MAKITLDEIGKESFGTSLPIVYIERVEIDFNDTGDGTLFDYYLSIKFTKPEQVQEGSAIKFIKDYLSGLKLYAFTTYSDWIKEHLEDNNFNIEYWLRSGNYDYTAEDKGATYRENMFKQISLADFVAPDNPYGSKLVTKSVFDKDGNEVVQLSNIKISCDWSNDFSGDDHISLATADVENLMFFTFIGPGFDIFTDDESPFTSTSFTKVNIDVLTANSYFGDITYYHVLRNDKVASKFFEAYTTSDGAPYFNEVLQSLNGKFFATDNLSFDDIKIRMEALIDVHIDNRKIDSTLDNNLKSLEAILNATKNRTGVLGEMSNYRSLFPDKDPTTFSGEFYGEFVVALADLVQAVQAEEELSVKLLYDSLVVDKRFGLTKGDYSIPNPAGYFGYPHTDGIKGADVVTGVPYSTPSDCYIPKKWFIMSRQAVLTDSISGLSDEDLNDLYGGSGVSSAVGRGASLEGFTEGNDEDQVLRNIFDDLKAQYLAEGYTDREARDLANTELDYLFSSDFDEPGSGPARITTTRGIVKSELLNPTLNQGSYPELRAGDAVVTNTGYFFFEYEKALRTQSAIAHTFRLHKLQTLFRINIPYEYFFVKKVELSRNDLRISAESDDYEFNKYIRSKTQLNMVIPNRFIDAGYTYEEPESAPSTQVNFPKNAFVNYKSFGGADEAETSDQLALYAHKLKYKRPTYKIGGVQQYDTLQFINFDLPKPADSEKLKFYNRVRPDLSMDSDIMRGISEKMVLDGYRLMAFYFRDSMDDDVAYYNSGYIDSSHAGFFPFTDVNEDRLEMLKASNSLDEARTCYSIVVEVVDNTQLAYDDFVEYLVSVFNEFNAYYDKAADICSFNNIKNEFNQFFIDAIYEETGDERPWVKATYVAESLSELLFGPEKTDFQALRNNMLETIMKISPETGNLFSLTAFAQTFRGLMKYVSPDIGDPGGYGPGYAGFSHYTPWARMYDFAFSGGRIIQFYNEKPIWEPISGDITPDITLSSLGGGIGLPGGGFLDIGPVHYFARPIGRYDPIPVTYGTAEMRSDSGASPFVGSSYTGEGMSEIVEFGVFTGGIRLGEVYPRAGEVEHGDGLSGVGMAFYGITDASPIIPLELVNNLATFELIFFPRNPSGYQSTFMSNWGEDSVSKILTSAASGGHADIGDDDKWKDNCLRSLKAVTTGYPSALGGEISHAAAIIDKMFRYSTVDLVMPFSGADYGTDALGAAFGGALGSSLTRDIARLRPGLKFEDHPRDRRGNRKLIHALMLLNRLAYTTTDLYRHGGRSYGDGEFYSAEYSAAAKDVYTAFGNIELIYYQFLIRAQHAVVKLIDILGEAYLDKDLSVLDEYLGLREIFNEDEPYGPDRIGEGRADNVSARTLVFQSTGAETVRFGVGLYDEA